MQRKGTFLPRQSVNVIGRGNCVGKKEGEGPLGKEFDRVEADEYLGEDSFEKAEMKLQRTALQNALMRCNMEMKDIDVLGAGDLLNQCVASGYGARESGVPFMGLYGACSTMALSIVNATLCLCAGIAKTAAAMTSSHFCSAERQFRYPLEYGGQRPPSAQWTVTGAGALVLSSERPAAVRVRGLQVGRVVDYGITDINNMGAAMAPAAADTLHRFFENTGTRPEDFDVIVTGDLGQIGGNILQELLLQEGYDLKDRFADCGRLIFSQEQDAHAGGSGCGCSAAVLTAHWLPRLESGEIGRLLFAATGALMSPLTVQQKESIPSVAHLVLFEREEGK